MDKFEDKIIDLVDIISESDPERPIEPESTPAALPMEETSTKIETGELESLIRKEVERLIKTTIEDNVQKMIKEVLILEVEKAVAREIESLKRT